MNKNEIGEIEDVIGRLGDIEDPLAEELAEILFTLVKPYIEADILVGDECQ